MAAGGAGAAPAGASEQRGVRARFCPIAPVTSTGIGVGETCRAEPVRKGKGRAERISPLNTGAGAGSLHSSALCSRRKASFVSQQRAWGRAPAPPCSPQLSSPGWEKGRLPRAPPEQHSELLQPSGTTGARFKKTQTNQRGEENSPATLQGQKEAWGSGVRACRRLLARLSSTSGEEGHPWKHNPESCPHTQGTCKPPCHGGEAPIPWAACEQAQELKQEA